MMLGGARLAALRQAGCWELLSASSGGKAETDMELGKYLAGLILAVTLLQGTGFWQSGERLRGRGHYRERKPIGISNLKPTSAVALEF